MRIKQGDRSVIVENNQGEIKTGDEIHHHHYAQSLPPALHQLPPPPADFTGREADIAELQAALEDASLSISGLQGMGGVGKTALALKLADRIKERYPDAQFYLDLRGVDPQPLTPAEAMAHVIHAYHPGAKLPESEAELRGIYLSALHDQRALLLMDNAKDENQVEPLMPPAGCALLVTSRQHFALPGFFAKSLDSLLPADSCKLLLTIAPRIGELAGEIAELCGHLPLALRLAGSAIAKRPNLKPADYARRLASAQERLKLIEATLRLSYEMLNEELQRRWRALSVFPGSFDVAAAAAVLEIEDEVARDALGEMIGFSLVEWNEAAGRYRLHDLARVFAESRLIDAERSASNRRHAEHYQRVLFAANYLYQQGGDAVPRGLATFDLERANIEAGQAWAAKQADSNEAAARLCIAYAEVGVYVLDLRQHPHERIQWLEVMLTASRRLNRRDAESRALGNLGVAYTYLGEIKRAAEFFELDLAIARAIGDRRGEGNALNNLGIAFQKLGETRHAIEVFEQRLVIVRELRDRRGEGIALGNLGLSYADLGETKRSMEFYEQDLAIAREIGDRKGESAALGGLGIAYRRLGEAQRAAEFFNQSLVISREIGDRRGEGITLISLGAAYIDLSETSHAVELFNQSLVIAREVGDRKTEGSALWNAAGALEALNNCAQAINYAEAALKIFELIEGPDVTRMRERLEEWRRHR
jgi:tetratricopeptide (TPR) repeat protein